MGPPRHSFLYGNILTSDVEASNDFGVAVAVPHFADVGPGVGGLDALHQQPRDGLPEAAVGLQGAVVLEPAVLGHGVARGLAGQLHPVINHHLSPVKAVQDAWLSIGGVWREAERI